MQGGDASTSITLDLARQEAVEQTLDGSTMTSFQHLLDDQHQNTLTLLNQTGVVEQLLNQTAAVNAQNMVQLSAVGDQFKKLTALAKVIKYISIHKHLPDVGSKF